MKAYIFRGALAEGLLKRDRVLDEPVVTAAEPEEFSTFAQRLTAADTDGLDDEDKALLVGRWVAHCLAQEHPEATRSILATRPLSREEERALRGSDPTLSACLLHGQVLKVDRLSFRALLAEAYYHRTAAALKQ
ncbi:MAG TPA: hypothetical protein VGR19_10880 [Allosphingosinicella sp.]|nr:hypothetical protein [Allosphingosinicella sp.]